MRNIRFVVVLGSLVVGAVALIVAHPFLAAGFWGDDFTWIQFGRYTWQELLARSFDPRLTGLEYRPVPRIQFAIEYALFRGEPMGYHAIQVLLHVVNSLLLYLLVWRVSGRWRIALIAGLCYAAWSMAWEAVLAPAAPDVLTGLFFLLAIWFWIQHLENGGWKILALAALACALALLTKEVAVALPFILLGIDRLVLRPPVPLKVWVKRNAIFFVLLTVYVAVTAQILVHRAGAGSEAFGWNVAKIPALLSFLRVLAFPWTENPRVQYAALVLILVVVFYALVKRQVLVPFLTATAMLTLLPVLIGGGWGEEGSRYLYLPAMSAAIGSGAALETLLRTLFHPRFGGLTRRWSPSVTALLLAAALLASGVKIAVAMENYGAFTRHIRLQFRPIFQAHLSFPPDTLLYFVDSPMPTYYLSGFMFSRYGKDVVVEGPDTVPMARLGTHPAAFVYYDEQGVLSEQEYGAQAALTDLPNLPVRFEAGISLVGIEPVNQMGQRGAKIVVLLYWSTDHQIDKDYTVFAHLVDQEGRVISGYDSQPRQATLPTTAWPTHVPITDLVVLPIDSDAPIGGDYRIELGLYDLVSMQRLATIGAGELPTGDHIELGPFEIAP